MEVADKGWSMLIEYVPKDTIWHSGKRWSSARYFLKIDEMYSGML